MKSLIEQYDQFVVELQQLQAQIAHVGRANYHSHEAKIQDAGAKLVAFEVEHGIDAARLLREHEKGFAGHLSQFQAMTERYSQPVNWPAEVASGNVAKADVESKMTERAEVLAEAKKSVATLTRMHADADRRRKKLSPEALAIAARPDPIDAYSRLLFTEFFANSRAERASNSILEKILEPAL